MKKNFFLICTLVFLSTTVFSQNFDFGIGGIVGTKMKFDDTGSATTGYGINARALVSFSKFGITGGASYFFPSKYNTPTTEYKNSYLSINADLIYHLVNIPKVKFYGLGGLANVTRMNKATTGGTTVKTNESKVVFEVGAGLKAGPISIEAKYQTFFNQFITTVGFNI